MSHSFNILMSEMVFGTCKYSYRYHEISNKYPFSIPFCSIPRKIRANYLFRVYEYVVCARNKHIFLYYSKLINVISYEINLYAVGPFSFSIIVISLFVCQFLFFPFFVNTSVFFFLLLRFYI